jgi:hypothetical protein
MLEPEEEQIHADAYIDSLLSRSSGPHAALQAAERGLDRPLQRAIDVLAGLPRFHPSFAFEEALAGRLRHAAAQREGGMAEVIRLPVAASAAHAAPLTLAGIDRRLLLGGAIASGFSLAGIGALVWRQRAR